MGTPTFMRIVFDRLSKASGDPAVVAAELVMLADSGYPLAPDAPEEPSCVDIANYLVGLPACDLAPVKALVARVFRGPFKRLLTSDPDSFSRALRYLLRAPIPTGPDAAYTAGADEAAACARACVQTIASLVEDVCVGGHDVVRSMRGGIDAVLDETRLLASVDRGAFASAMCHFYLAARDVDAVNELAIKRLDNLTSDARGPARFAKARTRRRRTRRSPRVSFGCFATGARAARARWRGARRSTRSGERRGVSRSSPSRGDGRTAASRASAASCGERYHWRRRA